MSNLQPELRVDKNGKIVTRHVKSAASSVAATSRLAPPTVTAVNPKHAYIDHIMEPLLEGESNSTVSATLAFLHNCPDHIVKRAAAAADSPIAKGVIAEVLLRRNPNYLALVAGSASTWTPAAHEFARDGDRYEMNQFANGLFAIYRNIADDPISSESINDEEYDVEVRSFRMEFIGKALGFDYNTRTHYDYYSRIIAIEPEHEAISKLLPVLKDITDGMSLKDKYGNFIPRPLTVDQVLMIVAFSKAHPERTEALIDFIKERKVVNQDIIREFENSSHSPLTRGLL